MRNLIIAAALLAIVAVSPASAECGSRGGPGIRGADGRCLSWAEVGGTGGFSAGFMEMDRAIGEHPDRPPDLRNRDAVESYNWRLQHCRPPIGRGYDRCVSQGDGAWQP